MSNEKNTTPIAPVTEAVEAEIVENLEKQSLLSRGRTAFTNHKKTILAGVGLAVLVGGAAALGRASAPSIDSPELAFDGNNDETMEIPVINIEDPEVA